MKHNIDYIRDYERDLIDKDTKRNELYNALWNMVFLKWDFSAEHKAKMPNVRTLVDASPSDAVNNASIALSNTIPAGRSRRMVRASLNTSGLKGWNTVWACSSAR